MSILGQKPEDRTLAKPRFHQLSGANLACRAFESLTRESKQPYAQRTERFLQTPEACRTGVR